MPIVKMPDGTYVDMPEKLDPAALDALQVKHPVSPWESAKEAGRAIHSGVTGAVTGLGGLLGDAAVKGVDLVNQLRPFSDAKEGEMLPRMMPSEALKKITGGDLVDKPKTTGGKYAASGIEGAVGNLLNPGSAIKNAFVGGSAGLGGEGAANAFGDNILTRLLGSFAGGGAAGLLAAPKTNTAQVAKEALVGADEISLDTAKQKMADAMARGRPINLSQAMERDSNIDQMVSTLASSRQGKQTTQLLRDQIGHVSNDADTFLTTMPGSVRGTSDMANQAQDAATTRFRQLGGQRTKLWEDTLAKSAAETGQKSIPYMATVGVLQDLEKRAIARPNQDVAVWLKGLKDKLVDDLGMPLTDPMQVNAILKQEMNKTAQPNLGTSGPDKATIKYMQSTIDDVREMFGKSFKPIRDANQAYQDFTRNTINPVKEGPLGAIAGPKGSVEGKAAAKGKLDSLFAAGTDPNAKVSDIKTVAKELNKAGQGDTFIDGVKTWLSSKIGKAEDVAGGRTSPDIAANIQSALYGDKLQKQGLQDMLAGVAKIHGVPEGEFVPGALKFFDYVGQASRRPASVAGTSKGTMDAIGGESAIGRVGHASQLTLLRQPILAYTDMLRSNAYKAIDGLINTPEGVDVLRKLAKSTTVGPVQLAAMATLVTSLQQAQKVDIPEGRQNPPGLTIFNPSE